MSVDAKHMAISPVQRDGLAPLPWSSRQPSGLGAEDAVSQSEPRNVFGAPDEAAFSAGALARRDPAADAAEASPASSSDAAQPGEAGATADKLSEEQRREIDKLKSRDAAVRAHEAAHMAAGGSHVRGGAAFTYQQGPDGRQYAIGGEVGIDVSAVAGNPQATIQKMQQVRAAALAPAEPSGADRSVAAHASQVEARARAQLASQGTGPTAKGPGASEAPDERSGSPRRFEATA